MKVIFSVYQWRLIHTSDNNFNFSGTWTQRLNEFILRMLVRTTNPMFPLLEHTFFFFTSNFYCILCSNKNLKSIRFVLNCLIMIDRETVWLGAIPWAFKNFVAFLDKIYNEINQTFWVSGLIPRSEFCPIFMCFGFYLCFPTTFSWPANRLRIYHKAWPTKVKLMNVV